VASALAAVQAEQAVRDVLAEHDVEADVRCDRWNPISTSWTSHENLMNAERRKSAARRPPRGKLPDRGGKANSADA
jgi:hypothetical protein